MVSRCFLQVVLVGTIASLSACGGTSDDSSGDLVTMNPANGSTLPTATVGVVYSEAFVVQSGGVAPYTFIFNGSLPSGVSFQSATTFSASLFGTPTATGTGTIDFQVIDDTGAVTQLSYPLTIVDPTMDLGISPTTLTDPTLSTAYSATLTETLGGVAPYTWSISSGSLPTGLTLDTSSTTSTTTISGTPTSSGTFAFTVTVFDSTATGARTGSQTYSLTVP